MFLYYIIFFTFLFTFTNAGFKLPIIPPTSPRSPFYTQLLAANNLPNQTQTLTLTRTHYQTFIQTKRNPNPISKTDYLDITYNKNAFFFVTELLIGDPVQLVYGIFDTGSDIVWFQCEGMAGKGSKMAYYNETKSSTYRVVGCKDSVRCQTNRGDMGCNRRNNSDTRCVFSTWYASKDVTKGVIASDVINLKPDMEVMQDFVFGCSDTNPVDLSGIIGASNSVYSMPKQIYPNDPKFSYCISGLVTQTNFVQFGTDAILQGNVVKILRHKPTRRYNSAPESEFSYFMDVIAVQVNGVDIKVDPSVYALSPDGLTGFTIDSGYAVTSLTSVTFDTLKTSISQILGPPTPYSLGFEICYPRTKFGRIWPHKPRPKIGIRFRDWVLELEESNVWYSMGDTNLECLQVTRTNAHIVNISVLGAEQLFDVNVGHDPKNNLLYLKPMMCPTGDQ